MSLIGNIYILSVVCGIKYMSDLGVGKECWGGGGGLGDVKVSLEP